MLNAEYHKYIKSQRWEAKCEVYWRKFGRYCKACKSTRNLQVHHMSYDNFGHEAMADLVGLCVLCHRMVHTLHRKGGRKDLKMVTLLYIKKTKASLNKKGFK